MAAIAALAVADGRAAVVPDASRPEASALDLTSVRNRSWRDSEDIRGETGDDFIALTALDSPWFERKWARPGRDRAIRDITIRHVKGRTNQCALIRILSHFGQPIHHVTITDVVEDSVPGRHNQTQMAVRIGDRLPAYYGNDERNVQRFGDIHDIQVDGLTTRALSAVHTDDGVRNLTVRNVRLFGDARGDGVLRAPCDT